MPNELVERIRNMDEYSLRNLIKEERPTLFLNLMSKQELIDYIADWIYPSIRKEIHSDYIPNYRKN